MSRPHPTERELVLLKVLWERGEATVREVYETLRDELPIVQNTVQAFLRTMTEKGLVSYEQRGRTFYYRAEVEPEPTRRGLLGRVLDGVYDGAVDQLVEGAVELRRPTRSELDRLRALVERLEEERE
ncbi:MAG: BlaI/MecI/CopY family transcriptional regulator [Planctomycetota bacterium]